MNNGCVHAACGQLDEEHMVRSDEKFADSQLEYCLCTSTFKQMQNRMMLINHCINELLYIIEREQVFGICNFLSWLRVPTDKIHCHRYDLALKIKPKKNHQICCYADVHSQWKQKWLMTSLWQEKWNSTLNKSRTLMIYSVSIWIWCKS